MTSAQEILIVDDFPANLVALESILRRTGATVIKATSGNEALTASLDHDFALGILDVQMPGMDGYELAELLRGDPATMHLPIVFLTAAYGGEQQVFRGYEAGAVDYIVKPFEPEVLLGKVRVFLELDAQRRELLRHRAHLEELVRERTADLERLNVELEGEVAERRRAEEAVRAANDELEAIVARRTAELTAVNRELEAFAYSVSHDLRAPLRAIEGFSQALIEDLGPRLAGQEKDFLDRLSLEARRMATLIEDLLSLSRVARVEMRFETVDLGALAQEVAERLRQAEPGRDVELRVADGLVATGDRTLLRQALANLLGNAWKFTGRVERPVVELGLRHGEGGPAYFVRDNGAGFDMKHADKLFAPFQRLHQMTEFPGTGVGLSTVQRIVARHGGRIWAEAEPGRGATFAFTLAPTGAGGGGER